jgi:hypothetical protein
MVAEDSGFDSREAKYTQWKRTTKPPIENLIPALLPKVYLLCEPDRVVGLLAQSDSAIPLCAFEVLTGGRSRPFHMYSRFIINRDFSRTKHPLASPIFSDSDSTGVEIVKLHGREAVRDSGFRID